MLCRKKKRDAPIPPSPRSRMLGRFARVIVERGIDDARTNKIKTEPPMTDFSWTRRATSIRLLASLLRLLSIAQNAMAASIRNMPLFESSDMVNEEKSRLVVTIIAPAKTRMIARYPAGANRSLKNAMAISTVKTTSALDRRAVSDAFALTRPMKYRLGAMIDPQTATATIKNQYLLAPIRESMPALFRGLLTLAIGVSIKNAGRYIVAESKSGFTFVRAGFATVEIEPNKAAAMKAQKYPTYLEV